MLNLPKGALRLSEGYFRPAVHLRAIDRPKLRYYLGPSLLAVAILVGFAGFYWQRFPLRYSSIMTLNLRQSDSSYTNVLAPRENYQIIANSQQVLDMAAQRMGRSIADMGQPKVQLVDKSTAIQVEFLGQTAAEARDKNHAFYQALTTRLHELRQQVATEQGQNVQQTIANLQQRLTTIQQQIAQQQLRTGLSTDIQLPELAANIENLRRQRVELLAEQVKTEARLKSLRRYLSLNPQQASDSLKLQADPLFQTIIKKYSEVTVALANTTSIYQPNHPAVRQERFQQRRLQALLRQRAKTLIGTSNLSRVNVSLPNGSLAQATLIQNLVMAEVDSHALKAQIATLDRSLQRLAGRLVQLAQAQSEIDTLKRHLRIIEALAATKLAQLNGNPANVYVTYPPIQLLAGPSLASAPVPSQRTLVMGGAVISALLITTGSLSLWNDRRKNWQAQVLHDRALPNQQLGLV
jgi:uncharacterized protein involved in exopolysaccharide biosynthesis